VSAAAPDALPTLILDPTSTSTYAGDFELSGSAIGTQRVQLVVDGRLGDAQTLDVGVGGRWHAQVDTGAMLDPQLEHRLVARDPASGAVSPPKLFRVQRQWRLLADVTDPGGDDHGRSGGYQYPTDPAFAEHRPNDLLRVSVHGSGGALRLDLTMNQLLSTWNPPNGFDHVAFTIYLQLPDRAGGERVMPLQFAVLPADMRWHYRVRANGWSNALFSAAGASAGSEGTPVIPTATLVADRAGRTVSFTLPGAAIGNPDSLSGARIYISTWDYDGGYRQLGAQPGPYSYGGGAAEQPRVMDELLIRLP
jgi:hypothetical protein